MKYLVILVIAAAVGAYYFLPVSQTPVAEDHMMDTPTPVAPAPVVETPPAPSEGTMVGSVREFAVTNSGFIFSPKDIVVKKGDTVKITYTNGGGTHDMRIEGYDVGTEVITAGQSETFEFVADEAGTFEFYCSVGQHRANGMVGTFTVTE